MAKTEESDLYTLVHSLLPLETKEIVNKLNTSQLSKKRMLIALFNLLKKQDAYNKEQILKSIKVTEKGLTKQKHRLFNIITSSIKTIDGRRNDPNLAHLYLEFEILVKRGLYQKAERKLNKIISLGTHRCDYEFCIAAQKLAIEQGLYLSENINYSQTLEEAHELLNILQEQSKELHTYRTLFDKILIHHYEFLDKRLDNRHQILEYLDHELLSNDRKYLSYLSEFYYYRILSIIHLGDNNHLKSKAYSLKALDFIESISSPLRKDFLYIIKSMNNYLDASLHLGDKKAFDEMFIRFDQYINSNLINMSIPNRATAIQLRLCCEINYLWMLKDYKSFLKKFDVFLDTYQECKIFLAPNISAEILLGFSKLYFCAEQYDKANEYCEALHVIQKKNPTHFILCCSNILRVMINYELGNLKGIPHFVKSSIYFLKSRNRYFKIEQIFLSGINKIKPYHSKSEKKKLFAELWHKLVNSNDILFERAIGLSAWIKTKCD